MRTVEQHRATILAAVRVVETELLPLDQAGGATLREPVRAATAAPPFRSSAMDGFAVRFDDVAGAAEDRPTELAVVADLPAGSPADPALAAGQAARIMTGAPVPSDADAIVPFEDTAGGLAGSLGRVVVVAAPRRRGAHIRPAGEDVGLGDVVLPAGVVLDARRIAAAATAGTATVVVSRRPRVAVVSTGSELVEPGESLPRGRIPESNSRLLAGLAREAGAEVVVRTSVDDDGAGLREVLAAHAGTGAPHRVDAVILSGGVSAGAYEVVRNELSGAMVFGQVAMRPGRPQGFGVADGTALFGLPGSPLGAAVSFEAFVRPFLLAAQGRDPIDRPVLRLPASTGWRAPAGRRQYLPVEIDRTDPAVWTVRPAGDGSHLRAGLAEAYAVVPADAGDVVAGALVDVLVL